MGNDISAAVPASTAGSQGDEQVATPRLTARAIKNVDGTFLCELGVSGDQLSALEQLQAAGAGAKQMNSSDQKKKNKQQQLGKSSPGSGSGLDRAPLIVILDRSGSMGSQVETLVNDYIPDLMTRLGYERISLITFDTFPEVFHSMTVEKLRSCGIRSRGCTYFERAIDQLTVMLKKSNSTCFRVLTISDGLMHDCNSAAKRASQVVSAATKGKVINSQAVRYFTSTSQPDTRGLSAVLQFNTFGNVQLVDLDARAGGTTFVDTVAPLFLDDGADTNVTLQCTSPLIMRHPWSHAASQAVLTLSSPKNSSSNSNKGGAKAKRSSKKNPLATLAPMELTTTFWLESWPGGSGSSSDNGDNAGANAQQQQLSVQVGKLVIPVAVEVVGNISVDTFNSVMQPVLDRAMNRVRVLKVLNTDHAQQEVQRIAACFEQQQHVLTALAAGGAGAALLHLHAHT